MNRDLPISDDDIRAVVRLVGEVAGSTLPLVERRRQLMGALVALVDADTWMWLATRGLGSENAMPFFVIDGGWVNDDERTRLWHVNTIPEVGLSVTAGVDFSLHTSVCFDQHHPGWDNGLIAEKYLRPAGFEHFIFSFYPMGPDCTSAMGVHRRAGRLPFTPREQAIVHLITSQIDWLHREGTEVPANNPALNTLSTRQREVLIHLLGGDSRKQVARKLRLSEHTIGDHVKELYHRLGVSSNTELLALFLPGQSKS